MVSWHSYLKEFKQSMMPLPYLVRNRLRENFNKFAPLKKVFNLKPITNKIKNKSYIVTSEEIKDSDFTKAIKGKAKIISYKKVNGFFKQIKKIIKSSNQKKYINVYSPMHDRFCHEYGVKSRKALKIFKKFDKKLEKFLKSIKGTNTKVIITADHGLIDIPKEKKIHLKNHPKLGETLMVPICGDHRSTFCFVKPDKKKEFEKYVKTKFKNYCYLYKSKDLVKKGYFGLEKPSKKFLDRIGDYTLIMKKDYGIYQKLIGESRKYNVGEHGGVSNQEMYVPLIVIDVQ